LRGGRRVELAGCDWKVRGTASTLRTLPVRTASPEADSKRSVFVLAEKFVNGGEREFLFDAIAGGFVFDRWTANDMNGFGESSFRPAT